MKRFSSFLFSLCAASLVLSPLQAKAGLFGDGDKTQPQAAPSAPAPASPPAGAPRSFADLSEKLLPAVVNISSTSKVTQPLPEMPEMPEFPEGSPFNDFFKDFMDRQGGGMGGNGGETEALPTTSLGSGFVIDAEKGIVVTNNHVVKDADEVRVILQDDTTLDAKIVG
ncbi:MAG TPA: hypothetical protein PKI93_04785, partial [Alphaproteobacteria bacterium]|nr:hypothetical protein [Alphaproteobacteria bacterium]